MVWINKFVRVLFYLPGESCDLLRVYAIAVERQLQSSPAQGAAASQMRQLMLSTPVNTFLQLLQKNRTTQYSISN